MDIEKVFENGSSHDKRKILIIISKDFIEFFFKDYYDHHILWLKRQEESGNIENLDDDALINNNFYWINKERWVSDKTERLERPDNFQNHMVRKNWFTDEMLDFINDNT